MEKNDTPTKPQPSGPPDAQIVLEGNPSASLSVPTQTRPIFSYQPGSVLDMAYGANDPNIMATQLMQSGQLFRLSRGFPYKRLGHMVPVFPKFAAQGIQIQSLASQPQSNRSAVQLSQPTVDATTTVTSNGTPFIARPGFTKISIT